MNHISVNDAKLFLNRETLTPQETALVERLLVLIESDISGYCGFDVFADPGSDIRVLEYVTLTLLVKVFNRISHGTVGIKSGTFQNLSIDYDLSDDLSPSLRSMLDRLRQTSLVA